MSGSGAHLIMTGFGCIVYRGRSRFRAESGFRVLPHRRSSGGLGCFARVCAGQTRLIFVEMGRGRVADNETDLLGYDFVIDPLVIALTESPMLPGTRPRAVRPSRSLVLLRKSRPPIKCDPFKGELFYISSPSKEFRVRYSTILKGMH